MTNDLAPIDVDLKMSVLEEAREHIIEATNAYQVGTIDSTELLMTVAKAHKALYGKQLTHAAVLKVVN